jgi:hypothetical protein
MSRFCCATPATLLGKFAFMLWLATSGQANAQNRGSPPKAAFAGEPSDGAATPAKSNDAFAAKQFRLILTYHGASDKPFYSLTLSVPPIAHREDPFALYEPIGEEQAAKIMKQLSASGFFQHAKITTTQNDPTTGPQYLLRVRTGDRHYEESLGWDIGTIIRLDGLRKVLDGNAAKLMDRLLERLSGQRKLWESGQTRNGLRTRLSADNNVFDAGAPIPMTLELRNESAADKTYEIPTVAFHESLISLVDGQGRNVPYLGRLFQLMDGPKTVAPGMSVELRAFDLASCFYLRRAGRYTVRFAGEPPSAIFELTIKPNPKLSGADGDPVAKLLPLVKEHWWLGAGEHQAKLQPGQNWEAVPGQIVRFVSNPSASNADSGLVDVVLCDRRAGELPVAIESSKPTAEYLGKLARWHVYLVVTANAETAWPTARRDIAHALSAERPAAQ